MHKKFEITNYKCFEHLTMSPIGQVNLIAGENCVGKTALLEAFFLHHGYHNPFLGIKIDGFRGLEPNQIEKEELFSDLFYQFDTSRNIVLNSDDISNNPKKLIIKLTEQQSTQLQLINENEDSKLETVYHESTVNPGIELQYEYHSKNNDPRFGKAIIRQDGNLEFRNIPGVKEPKGVFLSANGSFNSIENAKRFSGLVSTKKINDIISCLKSVDSRIKDLALLFKSGAPVIYADIGMPKFIPIQLLGDGISKLLRILLAVSDAKNGILLIDEIENGLHYSKLANVWESIFIFAKQFNVQIFATTHSYECIKSAFSALEKSENISFYLHRLEQIDGKINSVTYDNESFETAVDMNLEVR